MPQNRAAFRLADDSPLKELPGGLETRWKLLLDAIRLSIEMAAVSYRRLTATALEIDGPDDRSHVPTLLADAWGLVDAVTRLRRFIQRWDGWGNEPVLREFVSQTAAVQEMRDTVQHLQKRVPPMLHDGHPLLGELIWLQTPDPESPVRAVHIAIPGSHREGRTSSVRMGAMAESAREPIDHLTLAAWEPKHGQATRTAGVADMVVPTNPKVIALSLSATMDRVIAVTAAMEDVLRPGFVGHATAPTDDIYTIRCEPPPANTLLAAHMRGSGEVE